MKSAPVLVVELKPSAFLSGLLVALVVLSGVAAFASGIAAPWPWLLTFMAALWGGCVLVRMWRPRYQRLRWGGEGGQVFVLRNARGEDKPARLLAAGTLGSMVILRLSVARFERITLRFLPDNTEHDLLRRIRMRVRLG